MTRTRKTNAFIVCLLGLGVSSPELVRSAQASSFTAFAQDEDTCRRVGGAAIDGASGASAAQRYDAAYRHCMVARYRMRQMDAYAQSGQPGPGFRPGNPHSAEFPDAFFSIPYGTPGYGYDGFSY